MPYLRVQQDLQQRLANLLALLAVAPCRHARDVGMRQLRSPTAAAQQTQRARMLWRRQSRQLGRDMENREGDKKVTDTWHLPRDDPV